MRADARTGEALLFTYVDRAMIEGRTAFTAIASRSPTYDGSASRSRLASLPVARAYYPAAGSPVSDYYHVVAVRCR